MGPHEFRRIRAVLAAVLTLVVLAGCASVPHPNAVDIVVWQEQERQRLQAQGFPQYNFD